jgi:hypothetical protein
MRANSDPDALRLRRLLEKGQKRFLRLFVDERGEEDVHGRGEPCDRDICSPELLSSKELFFKSVRRPAPRARSSGESRISVIADLPASKRGSCRVFEDLDTGSLDMNCDNSQKSLPH